MPFTVAGVESVPLVGDVSRACRVVPGDRGGYRVPLPEVDSVGGFPGRCPGRCLGAACLKPRSVPWVIPADVPRKAEIEAVSALGRRSLVFSAVIR